MKTAGVVVLTVGGVAVAGLLAWTLSKAMSPAATAKPGAGGGKGPALPQTSDQRNNQGWETAAIQQAGALGGQLLNHFLNSSSPDSASTST